MIRRKEAEMKELIIKELKQRAQERKGVAEIHAVKQGKETRFIYDNGGKEGR